MPLKTTVHVAMLAAAGLCAIGCDNVAQAVAVGTLERDRVELTAEANERILEIAVREGDPVEPGQLVVRLDDRLEAARLAESEGLLARSQARLAELLRGTRPELVDQARAEVAEAQSSLFDAQTRLDRTAPLVEREVEPPARLDEAQARLGEAKGRLDAARANLERLIQGATVEELDQVRADVAAARAARDAQRLIVERMETRAPVAGTIDALPYEVGERPPAGAVVAVLLAERAPYARVYIPEPIRARVLPGVRARVLVDGRNRTFAGVVRIVSADPVFTPYFALTEHDRGRLAYVAEIDLTEPEAAVLPAGVPLRAEFDGPDE